MSEDLELLFESFYLNQIPTEWKDKSQTIYPPLSTWIEQLNDKTRFFRVWLNEEQPYVFWLGAFIFPQGFMTALLQNYSRQHTVPIDKISFQHLPQH